jgi:hypothetical protein
MRDRVISHAQKKCWEADDHFAGLLYGRCIVYPRR